MTESGSTRETICRTGHCNPGPSRTISATFACLLLLVLAATVSAQPKRLVVIKCDGLPYDLVDKLVKQRDPRSGKSTLPWIDHVFYQRGTRLSNFYVRGMSLSAPSWSLLDTGQHLQIKGNVEFDRYTLHSYDYLNFLPLYVSGIVGARIDMPAVEVLDSIGVPLMADAYPHDERYITFSLFLRNPRYSTLQAGIVNRFMKSPKNLFDEWTMGFELRRFVPDELIREVIAKIENPKLRYLDLFMADFDHVAHHNNDLESQLVVLKNMDTVVGQVWTAIQKTPLADDTALVLVSDHGFNSDEKIYSQGYNLVKFLGSRAGGGHHVITKRRLMLDYSVKGINPMVPLITTTSDESYYLKAQSTDYPTAMLDFDGNERASVHLRDSDLNVLHILLQQLQRTDLTPVTRKAATDAFFATLDRRRPEWQTILNELDAELGALSRAIEKQRVLWEAQPKKFTKEQQQAGLDDASKRIFVTLDRWQGQQKEYVEFIGPLRSLLALSRNAFSPNKVKLRDLIPIKSMGNRNSIYELQNYVVGLADGSLVVNANGELDFDQSFRRVDYFSLLHGLSVRNNVQRGVSNRPVDLIASRIPSQLIQRSLDDTDLSSDIVWVSAGSDKQALILSRRTDDGGLSLRYLPIRNLTQKENGEFTFERISWTAGLPLQILEDPNLSVPSADRSTWLSEWHSDVEWLHALHRTHYSNGLVGLHEELARHANEKQSLNEPGLGDDDLLMRRLIGRQRALVEADILVIANDHWNFDVRGFNPGGNHGSFFRISTHSIFMTSGGKNTGIPQAMTIEEPYDSLSFVPTLLALTGEIRDDSNPSSKLWEKGFRRFPGRVVKELLPGRMDSKSTSVNGDSVAP
jgi:hypothetical protein